MKRDAKNPSGFRDLLPAQALQREQMIAAITRVYQQYGFLPLETPEVEFVNTLIDDVSDFNLFHLSQSKERKGGDGEKQQLGLRFDLTVPLARVVAQYSELPKPFKRYQLGNVFRGERPQKGRYRQFAQFDADVVGAHNLSADVEIILMIRSVMEALDITNVAVRVNTRTLLNALPAYAGFQEDKLREVLIVLDKADKISSNEMVSELERLNLAPEQVEKLTQFSQIKGEASKVVATLEELLKDTPEAQKGLAELVFLARGIAASGDTSRITFDMSIIRGLAYYTGPVFETTLLDVPKFGSVCSGGRYDNLVEKFGTRSIPAVGLSFGVDRLYAALAELKHFTDTVQLPESYLVIPLDEDTQTYALSIASKLRAKGNTSEVFSGKMKSLGAVLTYAETRGFAYAALVGAKERKAQTIQLKNLTQHTQEEMPLKKL